MPSITDSEAIKTWGSKASSTSRVTFDITALPSQTYARNAKSVRPISSHRFVCSLHGMGTHISSRSTVSKDSSGGPGSKWHAYPYTSRQKTWETAYERSQIPACLCRLYITPILISHRLSPHQKKSKRVGEINLKKIISRWSFATAISDSPQRFSFVLHAKLQAMLLHLERRRVLISFSASSASSSFGNLNINGVRSHRTLISLPTCPTGSKMYSLWFVAMTARRHLR